MRRQNTSFLFHLQFVIIIVIAPSFLFRVPHVFHAIQNRFTRARTATHRTPATQSIVIYECIISVTVLISYRKTGERYFPFAVAIGNGTSRFCLFIYLVAFSSLLRRVSCLLQLKVNIFTRAWPCNGKWECAWQTPLTVAHHRIGFFFSFVRFFSCRVSVRTSCTRVRKERLGKRN